MWSYNNAGVKSLLHAGVTFVGGDAHFSMLFLFNLVAPSRICSSLCCTMWSSILVATQLCCICNALRACVRLRCCFVVLFCFALSFCAPRCPVYQGYQPFFPDCKGGFQFRPTPFAWSDRISPVTCTPEQFWEIRLILGGITNYYHHKHAGTQKSSFTIFF